MYPSSTIFFRNNNTHDDDLSTLSGSTVASYHALSRHSSWGRSRLKSNLRSNNVNGDRKVKEDSLLIAISDYILSTQKQEEPGTRSITTRLRESIRRNDTTLDVPFDEFVPKVIHHTSTEPTPLSPLSRSRRSTKKGDHEDDDESSTESLLECGWKVQPDGNLKPVFDDTLATSFTPIRKDELMEKKDSFLVGNKELVVKESKPCRSTLSIPCDEQDELVEEKKEALSTRHEKVETMIHESKSPITTPEYSKPYAVLLEKEKKNDAHGSKTLMNDVEHEAASPSTLSNGNKAFEVSTRSEGRDHDVNSSNLDKFENNDESIPVMEPKPFVHEQQEEHLISEREDDDYNGESVLMDNSSVSTMRSASENGKTINRAKQIILKKKMKEMDLPFDEIPDAIRPERRSKLNEHPHDEEIQDSFSLGRQRRIQTDAAIFDEDSSRVCYTLRNATPQEDDVPPSPQLTTLSMESYENETIDIVDAAITSNGGMNNESDDAKYVSNSTPTCKDKTPDGKRSVDNKIKNKKDFRSRLERLKQKKLGVYSEKLMKLHIYASNNENSSTVAHKNTPQASITTIEKVEVKKENNLNKLKDQLHSTKAAVINSQNKLVFFSSRKGEENDDDGSKISKKSHRQMLLDISLKLPPPPPPVVPTSPGSFKTRTTQTTASMSTISRSTGSHSTGYHSMLKELFEGDDETIVQDERSYVRAIPQTPSIRRKTYQKDTIVGLFSPPRVERKVDKINRLTLQHDVLNEQVMTLQRDVLSEQAMENDPDDHISCVSSASSSEECVSEMHQSLVMS